MRKIVLACPERLFLHGKLFLLNIFELKVTFFRSSSEEIYIKIIVIIVKAYNIWTLQNITQKLHAVDNLEK